MGTDIDHPARWLVFSWIIVVVVTALGAFATGMLAMAIDFELAAFVRTLRPWMHAAIVGGSLGYLIGVSYLVRRTLALTARSSTGL